MRILVLDDMEERHNFFRSRFKTLDDIVVHTYTYEQCILEMDSTPSQFDLIFLDHDLSITSIMCDPDNCLEKTGSDVAKYIVGNCPEASDTLIICHSMNPEGRSNMVNIFTDDGFRAVEIPFIHLNKVTFR